MSKRLSPVCALTAWLAFGAGSAGMAQTPPPAPAPTTPPQSQAPVQPVQPVPAAPGSMTPAGAASGQTPMMNSAPVLKLTFREAVERALQRNPTIAQATADILRADALLRQARSVLFPAINGQMSNTVATPVIEFNGSPINPRNSFVATAPATFTLSASDWARRNQAQDQTVVAARALEDARRQIAVSAAQAYLVIFNQRRLVETAERSRDTAKEHFDLANLQLEAGAGSRLNMLRAQQAFSADDVTVHNAQFAVYQAQEALGVLLAADGAVDAAEEPTLDVPPTGDTPDARVAERADIRLSLSREAAALRVLNDSWKDRLPTFGLRFTPQFLNPSTLFSPRWSTQTAFSSTVPVFDGGLRAAQKLERQALLQQAQASTEGLRRQASSEIRAAEEAVKAAQRSLASARDAAQQANQVVDITNIAFRAGASTNIEVIDAQRAARDADTNATLEEDRLRRAKLDLLVATGRFPQP